MTATASQAFTGYIAYSVNRVSARRLTLCLLAIAALLTALSAWGNYLRFFGTVPGPNVLTGMLDVDSERRVPTAFSSLLILLNSALLFAIAVVVRAQRTARVLPWVALALIFVYLAADEATRIHEEGFDFLIPYFHTNFLHFWVIPASIIMLVFIAAFWRFLFSLPGPTRNLFIFSGLVYVGGALGVETLGGLYAQEFGKANFRYSLLAHIEESAEMAGMILFTFTLISYLQRQVNPDQGA